MAAVKRQFIDGAYGQIHLRIAIPTKISKPPLYCLHMIPKSGRSYELFMRHASDDRIILAPDYPGYGESSAPPAEPVVTVEKYSDSIFQVAQYFNHEKIDLLGHHTGSLVAAQLAYTNPALINNIVMISAPLLSDDECIEFDKAYSPIPLDKEGSRFKIMWERINEHRGPGMTMEMMATSLAENLRGGEDYEWGHHAAFKYIPRFKSILPTLPHKITVLNPHDDIYEHTKSAIDYLQNGELIECPDWGHGFLDAATCDAVTKIKKALA